MVQYVANAQINIDKTKFMTVCKENNTQLQLLYQWWPLEKVTSRKNTIVQEAAHIALWYLLFGEVLQCYYLW